ncbi:MAG: hypothetical protein WDA25_11250 [Paracoccaceae bacterium]
MTRRASERAPARKLNRRLAWCPPHLLDEYRWLTVDKHLTAAEARAALQSTIAAFVRTRAGQAWLTEARPIIEPTIKEAES